MSDLPAVVFFGSDAICLPFLNYLLLEGREQCTVRAVVSQPDRRQGRGKLQPNPVSAWAREHGIELLQPDKPGKDLAEWLQDEQIALCFVMAYGHFLPKSVREAAEHGMVNFHGSILPDYRGASPVETALALGEETTGVSLMEVVREMDAGGVADVEVVPIDLTDTGPSLRVKIGEAVVPLMRRNLRQAVTGGLHFVAQDASRASFCRKIFKDDAAFDFNQTATALCARLRAMTPWPGGYFEYASERVKVGACSILPGPSQAPVGTILAAEDAVQVACAEGVIQFDQLQRPGGRMLPAAEFLRGFPIEVGTQLESTASAPLLSRVE